MPTPVQRQYWELKKQNPDAILFFRLGDFYEMFHDDAKLCARVLGITLTARHKGTDNEMPMCGMPYHSHQEYLETLITQGYKVAIAEQVTDKEGKITRKIDRVITPGTNQGHSLNPDQNSFLVGVIENREETPKSGKKSKKSSYALAVSDLSTGEFRTSFFENEILFFDEIYKLNPREILIESDLFDDQELCSRLPKGSLITPRKKINEKSARQCLTEHFKLPNLESFGLEKLTDQIEAAALVLKYLEETQKTDLAHIQKIIPYTTDHFMHLDHQTFRHLEIFDPLYQDENTATFISIFTKPKTAMGARLLRQWIAQPLRDIDLIHQRQTGVLELIENYEITQSLIEKFKHISDLERLLARICTGNGNPRDLAYLRDSLTILPQIEQTLTSAKSDILTSQNNKFSKFESLINLLQKKLVDTPPIEMTNGGIIRNGVDTKLDEYRSIAQNAQHWLDNYLSEQKEKTGINTLRVKFSKTFGFCLEVSKGQIEKAPKDWIRRQTLVNAERFSTPELAEYETKALSAESQAYNLEYQLFCQLRDEIVQYVYPIQEVAKSIAKIDVLLTFAKTAQKWNWNRPTILKDHNAFKVKDGRHPVVEKVSTETFIANNCTMSDQSNFHLITGPNMAGKSTYLRQNALIILLGQIGSFIPARSAQWGIVDRIFTRVGASDNLAGGKSTFFVEMTETAHILNAVTKKSFVILDEIGRGTSTFDGISLAWAIVEFLHDKIGCKTLFATHYHELTELANDLPHAENYHIAVSQNESGIIFLRKIQKGGVSDSFGIEVAKLAGVPKPIIKKARLVLQRLESENLLTGKPNLFNIPKKETQNKISEEDLAILTKIKSINPDELTPKQALDLWYEVKQF